MICWVMERQSDDAETRRSLLLKDSVCVGSSASNSEHPCFAIEYETGELIVWI